MERHSITRVINGGKTKMLENVNTNLALIIGLWTVAIATVPIYFWYKIMQRKRCKHEFENYRVCNKCGLKEKAVEQTVKEETKTAAEQILKETG